MKDTNNNCYLKVTPFCMAGVGYLIDDENAAAIQNLARKFDDFNFLFIIFLIIFALKRFHK